MFATLVPSQRTPYASSLVSDSGSLWVAAGIGSIQAWLNSELSYQRYRSVYAPGNAAIALVAIAQRVLSGLVSIRDAKAYEQSLSARTVGARPRRKVAAPGCSPASLIALPAESLLARTKQGSLSSLTMSLGFTLPCCCCFRGAGSELGERFKGASWQELLRIKPHAAL